MSNNTYTSEDERALQSHLEAQRCLAKDSSIFRTKETDAVAIRFLTFVVLPVIRMEVKWQAAELFIPGACAEDQNLTETVWHRVEAKIRVPGEFEDTSYWPIDPCEMARIELKDILEKKIVRMGSGDLEQLSKIEKALSQLEEDAVQAGAVA